MPLIIALLGEAIFRMDCSEGLQGETGHVLERLRKFGRLFVIKNRFEAFAIIYALALGATSRGATYLEQYPGIGGQLLFLAATGAVFLGGAAILDGLRAKSEVAELKAALASRHPIGAEHAHRSAD